MASFVNVLRNAIRPRYAREMAHKVALRWRERGQRRDRAKIQAWCRRHAEDVTAWALCLDAVLWDEATAFAHHQREIAAARIGALGIDLGGGGAYGLLYFLTRLLNPSIIVETGVAAGYSSRAFLTAIAVNGHGRLYSSDFPYFRLAEPERYIGYLVETELRSDWSLYTHGDRANLPVIRAAAGRVDIFHYDSDKSHEGRAFALEQIRPILSEDGLIIYDDIQDNWHFRDLAESAGSFRVFEFEGKWIGIVQGASRLYSHRVMAEGTSSGSHEQPPFER